MAKNMTENRITVKSESDTGFIMIGNFPFSHRIVWTQHAIRRFSGRAEDTRRARVIIAQLLCKLSGCSTVRH